MWTAIVTWFGRLLGGFALWKGDKLGKMIMYIVGGLIACGIVWVITYKLFFSPTLQNIDRKIQAAQVINNYTNNNLPAKKARNFVGLDLLGVKIGIDI